jgi:hypothetical protein
MTRLFAHDDDFDGLPASPAAEALARYAELLAQKGPESVEAEEWLRRHEHLPEFAEQAADCRALARGLRRETPTPMADDFALDPATAEIGAALETYAVLLERYGAESAEARRFVEAYRDEFPELPELAAQCRKFHRPLTEPPTPEPGRWLVPLLALYERSRRRAASACRSAAAHFLVLLERIRKTSALAILNSLVLTATGSFWAFQFIARASLTNQVAVLREDVTKAETQVVVAYSAKEVADSAKVDAAKELAEVNDKVAHQVPLPVKPSDPKPPTDPIQLLAEDTGVTIVFLMKEAEKKPGDPSPVTLLWRIGQRTANPEDAKKVVAALLEIKKRSQGEDAKVSELSDNAIDDLSGRWPEVLTNNGTPAGLGFPQLPAPLSPK